jgi:hypothetical protein
MTFEVAPELQLFAESVRAGLADWKAPLEPVFGSWQDDRDDALAARLAETGWTELWSEPGLVAAGVAGGIELGRAVAPLSLVDEATLGMPLCIGGRVRHGAGRVEGGVQEPTLDGTGTLRGLELAFDPAPERLRAWGAVTLAYLAGLADAALVQAVAHARSRKQFGVPLGSLPAVQARLADSALISDGLVLCAWAAAEPEGGFAADALAWAGGGCREVTAHAVQVHGGIGFALEGGLHRHYRRAKTVQVWTDAVLRATA